MSFNSLLLDARDCMPDSMSGRDILPINSFGSTRTSWHMQNATGLQEFLSEEVCDGQLIGTVRIRNPFKTSLVSGNDAMRGGSKR